MVTEVSTSCLPTLAGRYQGKHDLVRLQAMCASQTGHRHNKLSSQLSQLSLASEVTQSSRISSRAAEQQCSSDHDADSDTSCSSSALCPSSFALLASAQRQPRVSSSSSPLEPASPRPLPHPRYSRGVQSTQRQSPGRDQEDRDAGTKLIALKQKRHVSEGRALKPEVKRIDGNKQHVKHSAHSTVHRAQHADVSHQSTGIRQQHRAQHRLDEAELQYSQDRRKQPGASRHHAAAAAAAAAADMHIRRQAKQQHRVKQDLPSHRKGGFQRHSARQPPANTIPTSESSSILEQYSRHQQVSSRRFPGLVTKLQHDVETAQRDKQSCRVHSCPGAAKGQNLSRPAALLISTQPPWLEHDAAAVSDQAMHLRSTVEPHRQLHEDSQKHMEALQAVGSGQHEAALLTGATTAAHMTVGQSLALAKAVLTGRHQHCEGTVNAECRDTEAASGTATHPAHQAARSDRAVSPVTAHSQAVREGLQSHALETSLPGRVAVGAAGEPPLGAGLHSAAVRPAAQDVTPGPMQALLIALENMTNMGQQKLAALEQGHQPNPAAPATAAAAEPPVAAAAAAAAAAANATTSAAAGKTIIISEVGLGCCCCCGSLLWCCCCWLCYASSGVLIYSL